MAQLYQPYALISVIDPVLEQPLSQKIPPYVTYLLAGKDPHGDFNIRRRFREFLLLRNKLVQRFLGIYIPPIPSKRTANNTEDRQVEIRRRFLHYFTQKIAEKPYLFDSDIFQTFIRGDQNFQNAAKVISVHEYALIANIYDIEYKKIAQSCDIPKVLVEINTEEGIIKQVEKRLTQVRDQIQQVVDAKNLFCSQFTQCFKNILPKFQKEIIKIHDPEGENEIFSNNQEFKQKLDNYLNFCEANPLLDYIESLTYDIREAKALLQAIQSRNLFESRKDNFENVRRQSKQQLEKLKSGRTSLKSIFMSGNKQHQIKELQTYIPQYERNEGFLSQCVPLTAVAISREILQFKRTRSIDYLATLQIVAQKQMRLISIYGEMLRSVLGKKQPKTVNTTHTQKNQLAEERQQEQNEPQSRQNQQ